MFRQMSKDKNKLIPELRFPEFEKEGEWEYLNGDELFEPISNKNHNSDLPILAITQEQGAIPREMIDYHVSVTDRSIESYKIVEEGDFIISLRSFQGGIEYSNYIGLCSPAYIILRKKIDVVNDLYRHYFKSSPFIQDLNRNLEGIRDGKMVSYKQFSEILIPKPQNLEQQKIATCLSSLDELIAAHNDKLLALKDHKKGMMQNLFPQMSELGLDRLKDDRIKGKEILKSQNPKNHNSDNVPNYRFPEFLKDGEWVEKKFGDVYSFKITNSFSRDKLNYNRGAVKNIHYGDIHTRFSTLFDITNETVPYINTDVSIDRIDQDNYCAEGDMLFADASEDLDDVGKSIEIVNLNNELLLGGLHTFLARQIVPNIILGFGGYLFKSNSIRTQIKRESQGAKVLGISKGRISGIKILYPTNPEEQQKIATCLSSLDDLITAQAEKIEQLKLHKKGLMQGLFPKMSEHDF